MSERGAFDFLAQASAWATATSCSKRGSQMTFMRERLEKYDLDRARPDRLTNG
jgi:hypothetical protein